MSHSGELIIGLMSGTSVDGIDAALVEFASAEEFSVVETLFTPFPVELKKKISQTALDNSALFNNSDSPLHAELAPYYSTACLELLEKAGRDKQEIVAIANHGQTVRHEPNNPQPFSLQLGDGQLIADMTGIATITQFRQADLAAGGEGAPLMPAFHRAIFGESQQVVVLNIGGIANISHLKTNVIGFDTGPGNTLLDQWVEQHLGDPFDKDGEWAAGGTVIDEVLDTLMSDPYVRRPFPKSTGTDYYNLSWLRQNVSDLQHYPPINIQATLLAFTVESVRAGLSQLDIASGEIFVCGGGANNPTLMNSLSARLSHFKIRTTDEIGVPADWVEATGFAWLGYCYLHGIASNLPSVTGARSSVVLGQRFAPAG